MLVTYKVPEKLKATVVGYDGFGGLPWTETECDLWFWVSPFWFWLKSDLGFSLIKLNHSLAHINLNN